MRLMFPNYSRVRAQGSVSHTRSTPDTLVMVYGGTVYTMVYQGWYREV